jgi:hypothetical protein
MNGRTLLHLALASLTILLAPGLAPRAAGASRPEPHAAYAPPAARAPEVLTARARQRIEEEGSPALWVFFTDKGERDAAHFTRLVREAGVRLTDRSRERRSRENGGAFVPDYYDVPVVSRYVEAVASTGATRRGPGRTQGASPTMARGGWTARCAAPRTSLRRWIPRATTAAPSTR